MDNITRHPNAMMLAQRCKMGDISAMAKLSLHYKRQCGPELRRLLDEYERRPDEELQHRLKAQMLLPDSHADDAEAYIMWLLRGARFGDERAREQVERLPFYASYGTEVRSSYHKKFPRYLPFRSLLGYYCRNLEFPAWGGCIRNAGFPDVPDIGPGADCSITFWPSPGAYTIFYESDYIPADADGFGAESEYTTLWLDEFFCPIAIQDREELPSQLEQRDLARERYWASPFRRAQERKYRQRLRISTQIPWGRKWDEAAPLLGIEVKNKPNA